MQELLSVAMRRICSSAEGRAFAEAMYSTVLGPELPAELLEKLVALPTEEAETGELLYDVLELLTVDHDGLVEPADIKLDASGIPAPAMPIMRRCFYHNCSRVRLPDRQWSSVSWSSSDTWRRWPSAERDATCRPPPQLPCASSKLCTTAHFSRILLTARATWR
eukprot:TRINITY_DN11151_c0_g1_i1.p1 TRINITY_DN11151_c0_g1~~TRINITY_DN11151_c0_g1_i1.p1  ORF type:complete len:164 (-),score=18.29 TRINITY_DN11151_c0_g1_i1:108-599(-)